MPCTTIGRGLLRVCTGDLVEVILPGGYRVGGIVEAVRGEKMLIRSVPPDRWVAVVDAEKAASVKILACGEEEPGRC